MRILLSFLVLFAFCNSYSNTIAGIAGNHLFEFQDPTYTDSLVFSRLPAEVRDSAFFTFLTESGSDSIPAYSGTLQFTTDYQPSGSEFHPQCKEEDVYLARLTHRDGDSVLWDLRIGKGGQIYSFMGPYGEGVPPQWRPWDFNTARWVDDVWQIVSVNSSLNNQDVFTAPPGTTLGRPEIPSMRYFIHGAGVYMNDPMFLELNKPFYSPQMASWYSPEEKAYYATNWGQQAHIPSLNKSRLLYTYRYKDIGEGILEVTYCIQNFGDHLVNYHNMPWGGTRALNLPQCWLSKPDNSLERTYKTFGGEDPGLVGSIDETGGYFIWAAEGDDENRPALGIVYGKDVHYNDYKNKYNMISTRIRWGDGTNDPDRNYSVFTVNQRLNIVPGTTFFYRVYYINGTMNEVHNKARAMVSASDYGFLDIDPQSVPLTKIKTSDVENVLKQDINLFASPVPDMVPLFLMEDTTTGKHYISPDLYYNVTTQPFNNPYPPDDPKYVTYQDRVVYKPYDGKIRYIRLLGYGVKKDKISTNIRFALLDTLILDPSAIILTGDYINKIWIPVEYCDSCAVEVKPDPVEGLMLYNDFNEDQKIPWTGPVSLTFTDKVPNPDTSEMNNSYKVAKALRGEGKWAHIHFDFPQYLDLTVHNTFTLKAYFEGSDTLPDICNVRLILRNNGDGLTQYSVVDDVVKANEWDVYTFACPDAYLRNNYNQVWLFFSSPDDFGTTAGHTYYIDDLMGPPLTIQSYDIRTNSSGDSVIIDFSSHPFPLKMISYPEFKLYRSGTEKINLDSITYDSSHIYLHVDTSMALTGRDQLSLTYKSGQVEDSKGYILPFFSDLSVKNMIPVSIFYLKYIVRDVRTGLYLPGVSVNVDTLTGTTNLLGETNFSLPPGIYEYTLLKPDYLPIDSLLILSADTTVYLTMKSARADIQFKVTDGVSPVYKADIEINTMVQQTNTIGLATFSDMNVYSEYNYWVSKSGFLTYNGSLYLVNDTTVEIILEMINSIEGTDADQVKIFPVPPEDYLLVESGNLIQEIRLYNIYGQLNGIYRSLGLTAKIPVSDFDSGIYILKIHLTNGDLVVRKIWK